MNSNGQGRRVVNVVRRRAGRAGAFTACPGPHRREPTQLGFHVKEKTTVAPLQAPGDSISARIVLFFTS